MGVKGLALQRCYLQRSYAEGQHIVQLDDDIKGLFVKVGDEEHPARRSMLSEMVQEAEKLMSLHPEVHLWGINCSTNPLSLSNHVSRKAGLVGGPLFGVRNRHHAKYFATSKDCEDQERSLLHVLHDGEVFRFMMVKCDTSYVRTSGGLRAALPMSRRVKSRQAAMSKSARRLARLWPEMGHLGSNHLGERFIFKKKGEPPIKAHCNLKGRKALVVQKH